MRTADRLLAGAWAHPLGLDENDGFLEGIVDHLRGAEDDRAPVLVADNVARYVHARRAGICLEGYPSLAPPWPAFWIEYPSSSGRQRRGVWCEDRTELDVAIELDDDGYMPTDERHIPQLVAAARQDAYANGAAPEDVRWVLVLCLFVEQDKRVWGPAGILVLVLDHGG